MSRTTGKFKVVENGHVAVDKISDDITNFMERIPFEVQKLESKSIKSIIQIISRQAYSLLDVSIVTKGSSSCQCMGR